MQEKVKNVGFKTVCKIAQIKNASKNVVNETSR